MNPAKIVSLPRPHAPRLEPGGSLVGEVLAADGDAWTVRTAEGVLQAGRAPSCMLVPGAGDEVWLVVAGDGRAVIGAVTRRGAGAATVALPGDGVALVAEGRLELRGGGAVELSSPEAVRVRGAAFEVATVRTRVVSVAVELFAERLEAGLGTARAVARKLDAVVDALAMRAKQSFRWVEELEQVRAGQLDLRARGNVRIEGETAMVAAERVVQVRGEEVHLS